MNDMTVWILYRNHRGDTAWRHVKPLVWDFTVTPWHGEAQWIMLALDLDKGKDKEGERVQRSFAMKDIIKWQTSEPSDKKV